MTRHTFRYGDKTVVAGFRNAEGSPFGFSNLATHSYQKQNERVNVITVRSPVETTEGAITNTDGCKCNESEYVIP